MSEMNSVIPIYGTHSQAEEAVKELQRSGFDMKKMSIVGKDYHSDEHVAGYYNAGDRMKTGASRAPSGVVCGGCCLEPPSSPFPASGRYWWLVRWSPGSSELEGAVVVGGLSALGAGLYSIGIPKNSVVKYELALKSDKYLLLAHGTAGELAKARDILQTTNPVEIAVHAAEREELAGVSLR
jgi:hypothetical protein